MNVFEKLSKARAELQKKPLKKSGRNNYAGFEYFELGDFLPYINQIFADLKLASQFMLGKNHAKLSIINAEKPDEKVSFIMPVADANIKGVSPIQSLGGQQTYMRRYLWLSAMEIVEHDALDAVAGSDAVETKQDKIVQPKPHSYKAELLSLFDTPAQAAEWVKKRINKAKITEQEAQGLIAYRQAEIKRHEDDIPLDDIIKGEVSA